MDAEWLYLIGTTTVLGVFALVLFYMTIHSPGPKH